MFNHVQPKPGARDGYASKNTENTYRGIKMH